MKKALKWTFIIIGGLVVLLLAAAFIVPIVFKDDIKAAIDKEIAKSVNADVLFDIDKFELTLFKNFPNITAQMREFGVINRAPFQGVPLFVAEEFEVEVNLKDILFGDELRVKGISIINPMVEIHVLQDGRANYDIAIPSTDTTTTTEEPGGDFSFGIDHWEIVNGEVIYDDKSLPFLMTLKGLNHSGSGDFTQDVFDLRTKTVADTLTMSYAGAEYLSNKRVEIDATVSISEQYTKYTFKENTARLNDFALSFDGWFKMNEKDFGMDLSFKSPETEFKDILSLVPGMYSESFKSIETKGELAFNGFAKGTYSENQMPAFNLNLLVKDAMFKYPELPTPVNNINVDLLVDNKDGVIDNTVIDLKKLHLDLGSNPIDAKALVTKMYPTNVDATVSARFNLAELNKMFPMQGLDMKGSYALNLNAKGVYDSLKKTIPAIDATMSLADGFVKSADFPMPLEDLHFQSTIKNTSGKMAETFITVKDLSLLLDGERFNANLALENLDDYTWDLKAKGGVDLEKITKIFPLEGMTLAGKVKADIETKGKYSDVQASKYDRLPTSGSASLQNFKYLTKDLPPVDISQASMSFDPRQIQLQNLKGTIGKSDFAVSGSILNYIAYVFSENATIKGVVNFNSTLFDLNEFMTESETPATTTDTAALSVIPVPQNIDFVLKSDIKTVKLMNFTMTNASGDVVVKDGVANLSGLKFNMLGGSFVVNGTYNTKDLSHPKYDMLLNINNVSMKEASSASSLVTTYAPIAGLVNGNFSTDFKLSGELLQDMMPNMATVFGDGNIKIAQAALTGSKLVSGITSITKLNDTDQVTLKDVLMKASIKNGRLTVQPFDVKFGTYKTVVAGSTGLDGSLDYTLKMDVPAGKLGSQFNSLLSKYSTTKSDPNAPIPVTIGVGGNYANPSTKLVMDEQKQQVKDAATAAVKEEGTKALQNAVKGTEAEKTINKLLGKDTAKTTAKGDTTKATQEKQVEDAKNLIKGLLKKKKN
ncbi:AsmA family protein [Dawidia soli]|uniref:AsmA family protein n=1 Tax=Dawidia soli TaxID=2782352 RepID=A0AAP2GBK8_9BACT|nr:AsmA-like C-terminal region-containing protein [Dawidia soli]MBT1685279.1 AsmA family protein [Dawidia soli]